MDASAFDDPTERPVTAVTATEMRAVDRVAVEAIGLDLRRMMEHAGRGLAEAVLDVRSSAGNGGNGGGGLACARHLANRDLPVRVVLDRDPAALDGVTAEQLRILEAMDVSIGSPDRDTDTDTALAEHLIAEANVALVPGTAFGAPGHARISFATSMENLEKAMDRLEGAFGRG